MSVQSYKIPAIAQICTERKTQDCKEQQSLHSKETIRKSLDLGIAEQLQENITKKTIQLYNLSGLSLKHVQTFVNLSKEIVHDTINTIKKQLTAPESCNSQCNSFSNIVTALDSFNKAFDPVDSEYKRIKFLEDNGHYIPAEKVYIGERSTRKRNHTGEVKPNVKAYAHFYPLRKILKKIFEVPKVYDTVFAYKNALEKETNVTSNFIQSNLWKRKIQNFKLKNILPLILFGDDYETGRVLGRHSGDNKVCGYYLILPCFPPEYQSALSSIYHALLYYAKDRNQFGNFVIFEN